MMKVFLKWLRRRSSPQPLLSHLHFVVYTRTGCHLCELAWEKLQAFQKESGFSVETIDVDGDPKLRAQYGEQVPVVTVNGKVRFKGCINSVLLQRLLTAETAKARRGVSQENGQK